MKRFCLYSQCSHLNLQTLFYLRWMLRRLRCVQIFLKQARVDGTVDEKGIRVEMIRRITVLSNYHVHYRIVGALRGGGGADHKRAPKPTRLAKGLNKWLETRTRDSHHTATFKSAAGAETLSRTNTAGNRVWHGPTASALLASWTLCGIVVVDCCCCC